MALQSSFLYFAFFEPFSRVKLLLLGFIQGNGVLSAEKRLFSWVRKLHSLVLTSELYKVWNN